MANKSSLKFNLDKAREMADSFSETSRIPCSLYSADGELLYGYGQAESGCTACRALSEASGREMNCDAIHADAISQSERFGGRYIYFCPACMMFSASPIMIGGLTAGALIGGPVISSDAAEFLENDYRVKYIDNAELLEAVRSKLAEMPQVEPMRLEKISVQLFAASVLISDSSLRQLAVQDKNDQQSRIGEYVYQLKGLETDSPYPIYTEQNLIRAIEHGDRKEANRLLNEMLGYIFFFAGGTSAVVRARVIELLVILSRAAISGGANVETALQISERYMQEIQKLKNPDEIAGWLADMLNHYLDLVFDMVDIKHRNAIYKAIDYIRNNYGRHLTLNEVAEYVGYSHSYFSNIFKEEMQCSFRAYLNEVRIEKSKQMLLSGKMTILEISEQIGFADQSYFCKVFKQLTGVTPDKFRKSRRRIDKEKEYVK